MLFYPFGCSWCHFCYLCSVLLQLYMVWRVLMLSFSFWLIWSYVCIFSFFFAFIWSHWLLVFPSISFSDFYYFTVLLHLPSLTIILVSYCCIYVNWTFSIFFLSIDIPPVYFLFRLQHLPLLFSLSLFLFFSLCSLASYFISFPFIHFSFTFLLLFLCFPSPSPSYLSLPLLSLSFYFCL